MGQTAIIDSFIRPGGMRTRISPATSFIQKNFHPMIVFGRLLRIKVVNRVGDTRSPHINSDSVRRHDDEN